MPMKPKLSVVILCYRGKESIIPFIEQLERELQGDGMMDYELVLVGNYFKGFNDSTPDIVKELANNVYCGVRMGGMGIAIGSLVGKELANLLK